MIFSMASSTTQVTSALEFSNAKLKIPILQTSIKIQDSKRQRISGRHTRHTDISVMTHNCYDNTSLVVWINYRRSLAAMCVHLPKMFAFEGQKVTMDTAEYHSLQSTAEVAKRISSATWSNICCISAKRSIELINEWQGDTIGSTGNVKFALQTCCRWPTIMH